MNTKDKGDVAEAFVIAKCLQNGWSVLKPMGDNQPYDLVIDKKNGEGFKRVQVKTARIENGTMICSLKRQHYDKLRKGNFKTVLYTSQEIDGFVFFNPQDTICYFLTFDVVKDHKGSIQLRLEVPKNNQIKKIIWAKDFEMHSVR